MTTGYKHGNKTIVFILLGLFIIAFVMITTSFILPKQIVSCTGLGGSSTSICTAHFVRNGTICIQEVSPSISEGLCSTNAATLWQFTQFWQFDMGIAGFIVVLVSLSLAIFTLMREGLGRNKPAINKSSETVLPND